MPPLEQPFSSGGGEVSYPSGIMEIDVWDGSTPFIDDVKTVKKEEEYDFSVVDGFVFMRVWRFNVYLFARMLADPIKKDSLASVLNLSVWNARGIDSLPVAHRTEWVMNCFDTCRFAIERAWEILYEIRPLWIQHPASAIVERGQEVRTMFASLVREVIFARNIERDVLTSHRWAERQLTDNEDYTALVRSEERKLQALRVAQQILSRDAQFIEKDLDDETQVDSSEHAYPIGKVYQPHAEGKLYGRLNIALSETLGIKNTMRLAVLSHAAEEIVGPWIEMCPNEAMKLQTFVIVAEYMTARARMDDAKELHSRRKRAPRWIVDRLIYSTKTCEHKLRTLADFVKRRK